MKKGIIVLIAIVIICSVVVLALGTMSKFNEGNGDMDITSFKIGNKEYKLSKGDVLQVNGWDDEIETLFNDEEISGKVVLFNGVEIGTNVDEVIEKFEIKSGYANLNMEVPTEERDGTTDVINVLYEDKDSFHEDFLDAMIEFGYKNTNNGWELVKYSDIENADVLYSIDINGFDDENVDLNSAIMFNIEYVEK